MLRLTFRTKLLLAMMFVVTGVTVALLLVAQRRVQTNYERMFRTQFERQIGYFTTLQESRLGAVKEECLKLAKSVRLVARMSEPESDSPDFAADIYRIAEDELRTVLEADGGESRLPATGPRNRSGRPWIIDANGKVIPPPERSRFRAFVLLMRRRLEPQKPRVREALESTSLQQVGYLALEIGTNQPNMPRRGLRPMGRPPPERKGDESPMLQEVIVTKVVDSTTGRMLGAVALAFPLPELIPNRKEVQKVAGSTNDLELIQSGVLLDDKLYADPSDIPDSIGEVVAQKVSAHIKATQRKQADLDCDVGTTHYRAFYELMSDSPAFPPAYQVCLYSKEAALREQRRLQLAALGLGGVGLVVALALSLLISHGLAAPIRELVSGTGEIQKGNFQVRLPVRSRDEVGQLTTSFNDMAEGLAQKERYRTVLNMVADERVAQRLIAGEVSLGGNSREVTVLFCDIRGFTALTQNMPAGEIIEMVNEHMTAMTRVVHEHKGLLDKFVGDLLMAVFGAPISEGDDTANATRCALRLMQLRQELNRTSRHQLRVGIGLATGTVVAGCMGSTDRLNYTVLGERVNLASRLCARAGAGEILIDESTRRKLGNQIQVEAIGEIELKGFATPVPVLRLVGVKA